MLLAALLALILRGSVLASAVGTFAGNPLTYPMIWFSTFTIGNLFLRGSANAEMSQFSANAQALGRSLRAASPSGIASAVEGLWPLLKPMAVGAIPLGGGTAALVYFLVRHALESRSRGRMTFAPARSANS